MASVLKFQDRIVPYRYIYLLFTKHYLRRVLSETQLHIVSHPLHHVPFLPGQEDRREYSGGGTRSPQRERLHRGAGTILLNAQMKNAREKFDIEILHLEVYEGNPARRLYKRLGFTKFGEQRHFIKEDGHYRAKVYMQKEL